MCCIKIDLGITAVTCDINCLSAFIIENQIFNSYFFSIICLQRFLYHSIRMQHLNRLSLFKVIFNLIPSKADLYKIVLAGPIILQLLTVIKQIDIIRQHRCYFFFPIRFRFHFFFDNVL